MYKIAYCICRSINKYLIPYMYPILRVLQFKAHYLSQRRIKHLY